MPRKKSEVQLTEAHTPDLATAHRCRKRKAQEMMNDGGVGGEDEREQPTTFHAKPMPDFGKITVSLHVVL